MADAPLHTAVETPSYEAAARRAKLSQAERDIVLDSVMRDPTAGDLIRGSGGVRKLRVAKEDIGKSGGYRVLTFFMDRNAPVYLLFVLDKKDVDNINAQQTKQLKAIAKAIKDAWNQHRKAQPQDGKGKA